MERKINFSRVMNDAFDTHRKMLLHSALYLFIFYVIYFALIFGIVIVIFILTIGSIGFGSLRGASFNPFIFLIFIPLITIIFFFGYLKKAGIIHITKENIVDGNKLSGDKALGRTFKSMGKILLTFLAYLLGFLPIICLYLFSIFMSVDIPDSHISLVIFIISLILSIILTVYYINVHLFAMEVTICENICFFKALKRSRQLVKGQFFKIFGSSLAILMVTSAVIYSLYAVVGIFVTLFALIFGFNTPNSEFLLIGLNYMSNIVSIPFQVIAGLFIQPILGVFMTHLYFASKGLKRA